MENKCEIKKLPLGRNIALLAKAYFGILSKELEELDIERYFFVLTTIEKKECGCSQQQLSDAMQIDKVTIVRIVDYLVAKGYLQKTVNEQDRREHVLQLTPKASESMPFIHKAINYVNEQTLRGFSDAEKETFIGMVQRAYENLYNLPRNKVSFNFETAKSKNEK